PPPSPDDSPHRRPVSRHRARGACSANGWTPGRASGTSPSAWLAWTTTFSSPGTVTKDGGRPSSSLAASIRSRAMSVRRGSRRHARPSSSRRWRRSSASRRIDGAASPQRTSGVQPGEPFPRGHREASHRPETDPLSGHRVKLTLQLFLPHGLAEYITARAIREGKNVAALVAEILREGRQRKLTSRAEKPT